MCSRFYQWYQWYTNILQGSTNGTIGNTICTNGDANVTIASPNGTIGTIGKPMVPLATNGTIGKITNGTIGRTPNRAYIYFEFEVASIYEKLVRSFQSLLMSLLKKSFSTRLYSAVKSIPFGLSAKARKKKKEKKRKKCKWGENWGSKGFFIYKSVRMFFSYAQWSHGYEE